MHKCRGLVLVVCLLFGCSGGFNRELMPGNMREEALQVTDADVRKAQELRPQLVFPCRVAVYLQGAPHDCWRWTPKDKELFEACLDGLRQAGIVSDAFLMSDLFVPGTSLKELRLAAAQHGADALLVVKGGTSVESYYNPAAVLNLTVVGGYVIPASHRDALFTMQGGLIDVSNGYLYASMEAEGEGKTIGPTFLIEDKNAVGLAKTKALERFIAEVQRRLHALRNSSVSAVALPVAK